MADARVRVALLARAGRARDQLHRALDEAGAEIVAEGDPGELDPGEVASRSPNVFLVSLEPATESALDRFDELLAAPGVEVMFDEAEVTAKLDGWDLNRWARHVAAKLVGSDGMPPVPEGATSWQQPDLNEAGAPPTPASLMDDARLEDYTADTSELADSVPVSQSLGSPMEAGGYELDLDLADLDIGSLQAPAGSDDAGATEYLELSDSISFSSFSEPEQTLGDLDADVAELAAHLEAFEKTDQRFSAVGDNDFMDVQVAPVEAASAATPVASRGELDPVAAQAGRATVSFDFSNLALAPFEGQQVAAVVAAVVPAFAAPAAYASEPAVEIADAGAGSAGLGAVVILAGLGGPDAVRQLLSSLPESLKVPVLLYQHLEVGKHERLVEQLAKISKLPVVLAREGQSPVGGEVTLLPAGLTATVQANTLAFTSGGLAQMLLSLPAPESMVIVLSGADPQLVPMILAVKDAGGLVLAQDPEVCFDAAAAEAMQREGAAVYPALGLARQIAARWSL